MNDSQALELLEQRRLARRAKRKRDEELLRLHQIAADVLSNSPEAQAVRERALLQVDKWERGALCSRRYITEWRRILALPPSPMRQAMLRVDDDGVALRQNTPFCFTEAVFNEPA